MLASTEHAARHEELSATDIFRVVEKTCYPVLREHQVPTDDWADLIGEAYLRFADKGDPSRSRDPRYAFGFTRRAMRFVVLEYFRAEARARNPKSWLALIEKQEERQLPAAEAPSVVETELIRKALTSIAPLSLQRKRGVPWERLEKTEGVGSTVLRSRTRREMQAFRVFVAHLDSCGVLSYSCPKCRKSGLLPRELRELRGALHRTFARMDLDDAVSQHRGGGSSVQ